MSLFSRKKDPVEPARADEVPFESLRRSPRSAGRSPGAARAAAEAELDAPSPLDPAHAAKTRARRRLIGAIALALAAIVFVPMLFDRTQVAPTDDIAVQIPDRDTPFEGRRGVPRDSPDTGKAPLRPSGSLPSVSSEAPGAGAGTANSDVAAPPVATVEVPKLAAPRDAASEKPAEKTADRSADKAAPKTAEKHVEKNAQKPGEKGMGALTTTQADDPRALAALEGKPVTHAAAEPASGKGYAVQIAAYSVADKARNMRDRLTENGLKAYMEPLSTPQGTRTRVRLGPFASREAAERAREKLKTMKLDGAIVTL